MVQWPILISPRSLARAQVDKILARQQAKKDKRIAALRTLGDYMDFDS
jgi:hypothetical protein